jgi:hypothetical protein
VALVGQKKGGAIAVRNASGGAASPCAIHPILGSDDRRDARKQFERGVPPNLIENGALTIRSSREQVFQVIVQEAV